MILDQGANGIGDALPGLLATSGYKKENPDKKVIYRVHRSALPWVALFDGYDELGLHARDHNSDPTPGALQLNIGYPQEWDSRLATGPRWLRYCYNAGVKEPVLPELREPERLKELGKAHKDVVVLCPFSLHDIREWPLMHWLRLESLLIADGFRTVVVHGTAKTEGHRSVEWFKGEVACGLSPDRVAGIMLNSRLVIANDSGPAHFAGILGVPTLVLVGNYPGDRIFGCYDRVTCVQAE